MAGRGRGRANTLPAWMTKQGVTAPPPGSAANVRPPSSSQGPPVRNGQFEDAPEPVPRGVVTRNDMGDSSSSKRRLRSQDRDSERYENRNEPSAVQDRTRSRSRDRRNGKARSQLPVQDRVRSRSRSHSRSRSRGNGRSRGVNNEADRRWEATHRRGHSRGRSRSRERRDYRGDNRRGDDNRREDRGYGYRRHEGRTMNREEEAMERGYRRTVTHGHDDRTSRRYASDYRPSNMTSDSSSAVASLPGLTPSIMSPSGNLSRQEDVVEAKKPTRAPKLLFAAAKNVVNASNATRLQKQTSTVNKRPVNTTKGATGSMRTVFGVMKRGQSNKPEVNVGQYSQQEPKPFEETREVTQQSTNQETQEGSLESKPSNESVETDVLNGGAQSGQALVDDVKETLAKLLTELDSVDPSKLLAVRLGAELRGLLGKAHDEFGAYAMEFVEYASNEGVSVALQNFSASLTQVFAIAGRLRIAKFMLNRTFKSEVLFAFQEINAYYTSLFMELSMAIARRSDGNVQSPLPITPPPVPEPEPTGDELCLQAHQHFFGHGVSKDIRKAFDLYTQAANLDCAIAMTCLGQMYFAGNGTEKDLLVAEKWFKLASSAGDLEACYQLGLLMCEKAAHTQDTRQSSEFLALARVCFAQAAGQGHHDAQYELGVLHESGRGGCEVDEMEAMTWYAKAASQGHTGAESSLGRLFLTGTQNQHDAAKAVHFLQRAAVKNDASAQTRLGLLYTTGNGVKQDLDRGVAYLQSAAEAGSSVAMTRLASLLLVHTSKERKTNSDPISSAQFQDRDESHDEALRLLLNAGNGGHTDAYYVLGNLLETSSQLRDQSAALRFYSKAATAATPHTKAAKRVASMYYSAIGCKTDKCMAHQFYTIAANAGDAEALNALGLMYEEGEGCDLNYRKAVECYRSAADINSPHAHFNLGCLLSHGKGVPRNVDAAQAHFRKAKDLGYSLAQQFVQDEAQ